MIGYGVDKKGRHLRDGLWYVESLRVLDTEPPKEVVTVSSMRRLVTRTPGPRQADSVPLRLESLEVGYLRLDLPYERCTDMPPAWFEPIAPPRFWKQPQNVADAIIS
jgi:hypothetical protein